MGWLIFAVIAVVLIGVAYRRSANHNYRTGSGLFKSSEYNLEEKDDICDKDYYDKDGLMK